MIMVTHGILVIKEKYDQRETGLGSVCERARRRERENWIFFFLKESNSFLIFVDIFLMRFSSFWHDLFLWGGIHRYSMSQMAVSREKEFL